LISLFGGSPSQIAINADAKSAPAMVALFCRSIETVVPAPGHHSYSGRNPPGCERPGGDFGPRVPLLVAAR
jgi:hypothetical protein